MDKPLYAAQQVIAGNTELFWCRASLLVLLFYGSAFCKIADMHLVVYEQDVGVQNTGLEMIGLLCLLNIYISIYPILELADYKIVMICLFLIYDWKKKSRVKYLLPMAMADSNIFMNMLYLYTQTYWYFMCIIEIVHIKKNSKKITTKITPPPNKKEREKKRSLSCRLSNRPCRIYIWCSAVFVSAPDFPVEMTKWFPSETHYFN